MIPDYHLKQHGSLRRQTEVICIATQKCFSSLFPAW